MWDQPENDAFVEELYLAGERVSTGLYRQVGCNRQIRIDDEDVLPASLDGHVACYVRVQYTWADLGTRTAAEGTAPSGQPPRSA